jgi:hypothetical protein
VVVNLGTQYIYAWAGRLLARPATGKLEE